MGSSLEVMNYLEEGDEFAPIAWGGGIIAQGLFYEVKVRGKKGYVVGDAGFFGKEVLL